MIGLCAAMALSPDPKDAAAELSKGMAKVPAAVVQSLNRFGHMSLEKLASGSDRNIMISPWSLQECFGMLRLGARGQTDRELRSFLMQHGDATQTGKGLQSLNEALTPLTKTDQLRQANGLWVGRGFQLAPAFQRDAKSMFGASVNETTFPQPGLSQINGFVSSTTRGKIPKLFDSIDADTKLVLVNAVSFLDKWKLPFAHGMTSDQTFTPAKGSGKKVPMMSRKMFVAYGENSSSQVIRLPYQSGLEMTIWLPKKGTSLGQMFGTKMPEPMNEEVTVTMPKWKSEFTWDLKSWMMKQGVKTCFGPGADFTGISKAGLFIGQALQKTYIRVDEDGTEASAATGIMMPTMARPGKPVEFRADHAFAYSIGYPNGVTLFMGVVNNP